MDATTRLMQEVERGLAELGPHAPAQNTAQNRIHVRRRDDGNISLQIDCLVVCVDDDVADVIVDRLQAIRQLTA